MCFVCAQSIELFLAPVIFFEATVFINQVTITYVLKFVSFNIKSYLNYGSIKFITQLFK